MNQMHNRNHFSMFANPRNLELRTLLSKLEKLLLTMFTLSLVDSAAADKDYFFKDPSTNSTYKLVDMDNDPDCRIDKKIPEIVSEFINCNATFLIQSVTGDYSELLGYTNCDYEGTTTSSISIDRLKRDAGNPEFENCLFEVMKNHFGGEPNWFFVGLFMIGVLGTCCGIPLWDWYNNRRVNSTEASNPGTSLSRHFNQPHYAATERDEERINLMTKP
jgi:hypothetical protein